jgi:hypothetical protein
MINMVKSYAKIKLLLVLGAFFLPLLTVGCNQDSIFDDISWETAPTQPKIKGSPSKMVEANMGGRKLYIANGRLWEYDLSASDASWTDKITGPGGYVADVAFTTDGVLYALTMDNTSAKVWKKKDGTNWSEVTRPGDYGFIQNIFGAGDTLFAAGANRAGDAYNYAILYYKNPDPAASDPGLRFLTETDYAILTGAGVVGTDYYLATLGNGIYKASFPSPGNPTVDSVTKDDIISIAGFLQAAPNAIIGISRIGHILYIDSSGIKNPGASLGATCTGALALMDNPAPQDGYDKLLLFGYKGPNSSYRHGYLEVQFKSSNGDHETPSRVPGSSQPSSIKDDSRKDQQYTSSLRRYPVTALWVLPSADPTKTPSEIFAATTNQGVYSYRDRSNGGWQWNHEE